MFKPLFISLSQVDIMAGEAGRCGDACAGGCGRFLAFGLLGFGILSLLSAVTELLGISSTPGYDGGTAILAVILGIILLIFGFAVYGITEGKPNEEDSSLK
jgi:hypothetical protein